jgi:hypothetical protein
LLLLYLLTCSLSPMSVSSKLQYANKQTNCMVWVRERTIRATASCRRSDCQLLQIKGATWSGSLERDLLFVVSALCMSESSYKEWNWFLGFDVLDFLLLFCHSHHNHDCLSAYKKRVLIPSACLLNVDRKS